MDDILRTIYMGNLIPMDHVCPNRELIKKDSEMLDEMHQKIIEALIEKNGEKEAKDIDDAFISAGSGVTNEEMYCFFKQGFYIGYDIAMAVMKRE